MGQLALEKREPGRYFWSCSTLMTLLSVSSKSDSPGFLCQAQLRESCTSGPGGPSCQPCVCPRDEVCRVGVGGLCQVEKGRQGRSPSVSTRVPAAQSGLFPCGFEAFACRVASARYHCRCPLPLPLHPICLQGLGPDYSSSTPLLRFSVMASRTGFAVVQDAKKVSHSKLDMAGMYLPTVEEAPV